MAELGKMEKPAAESFTGKRKLYCVPNVYPINDAPDDYKGLFNRYWDEVSQQTEKLEMTGKVRKIFCENLAVEGEKAVEALAKYNERASQIVRKKIDEGALLLSIETSDILGPFLDWANCLSVVRTQEVFTKVFEFYNDFSSKRLQHVQSVIESNLAEDEAGLLIMRDEDRMQLQFAADIDVFLVTPPSYDDILRWLRDKLKTLNTEGRS